MLFLPFNLAGWFLACIWLTSLMLILLQRFFESKLEKIQNKIKKGKQKTVGYPHKKYSADLSFFA